MESFAPSRAPTQREELPSILDADKLFKTLLGSSPLGYFLGPKDWRVKVPHHALSPISPFAVRPVVAIALQSAPGFFMTSITRRDSAYSWDSPGALIGFSSQELSKL